MADPFQPFEAEQAINPLRGTYFRPPGVSSSPESATPRYDGLTAFQRQFLTDEFMNRVLPVQKELQAMEERRKQSMSNDMRLEEQTIQLEALRDQTKKNRDMLTRIPILMQDLDPIVSSAEQDPGAAALTMLQLKTKHADLIAADPSARIAVDAVQQRLQAKAEERRVQQEAELRRIEKLASVNSPEMIQKAEELATQVGGGQASKLASQILEDSELIRGVQLKEQEKAAAQQWAQSELEWLKESEKFLEGIKSDKVEEMDYKTGKTTTSFRFAPEVESMVDRLAANLAPGVTLEKDLLKKRNQLLARIAQQKQQLMKPKTPDKVSATAPGMRGSSTSR